MPIFRYEALDETGQSRTGEVEAADATGAAILLTSQALVVVAIELVQPNSTSSRGPILNDENQRAYEERIGEILREPGELIELLKALAAEPASAGLRQQLNFLLERLREGVDARQFLTDERLCQWLPVVLSTRRETDVESRYSQLLTQVLDERTRRRSLITTFTYPIFLLGFLSLVLIPICVFIVPTFQNMFDSFGLRLPPPTKFLFELADLVNYRPLLLLLALASMIGLAALLVYVWVSNALATHLFGWLIAGNSINLVAMSRLTSVLADLIELGAPVSEALMLAGRASRHAFYSSSARQLAIHLAEPNFSWQASPVAHNFPVALLHALSAGEGGRASAPLIRELSHIYSHRVSARANRGAGFVSSPLMVIGVGMIVALVVLALFMPLVSMISSLS